MAEIRINATGGVKLFDADDSHYAQIVAGTITSNTDVLTLGHAAIIAGTKIDLNGQELILDADADTSITADTDDQIDIRVAGTDQLTIKDGALSPVTDNDVDIGTSSLEFKDGYFDGTLHCDVLDLAGTEYTSIGSNLPSSADGQALGSASAEWSDLFLADGGIIKFGNDQDVLLTHVADTGLLLSGTNVIQFNDASQNIGAPSATVLDINATDEIELNATAIDINGTADISGTTTLGGTLTVNAGAIFNEASADVDFRIESNGNTHALFVDAGNDRIGILKSDPAVTVDVTGTIRASGGLLFGSDTAAENTLDDYEEGSADLTFQDSAGANYNGSYGSVRNFRYQKIGNKVYGQYRVQTNSGGNIASGLTSSNAIQLSGLPFTSNAAAAAHYGIGFAASDACGFNFDGDDRDVFCYVEPGQSIIKFAFMHDNDEPERVLVSEIPVFSPGAYAGYMLAGNLTYIV